MPMKLAGAYSRMNKILEAANVLSEPYVGGVPYMPLSTIVPKRVDHTKGRISRGNAALA
jgi:hypothetical protein